MTVIAIDGTFASGKGTLAKRLAAHYDLQHLDTGKLYRAVAQTLLSNNQNPDDAAIAQKAAEHLDVSLLENPILKSGPVGVAASKVAIHPGVRAALLNFQRKFAAQGAVLDGRDIGTVICPDADVKRYINANPKERAKRRLAELQGYGEDLDFETVLAQLKERDHRDSSRTEAPLKPADDAHLIDTTNLSIQDTLNAAITICEVILKPEL